MLVTLTKIYHYGQRIEPVEEEVLVNLARVEFMESGSKGGGYADQKRYNYTRLIFSTHNLEVKESLEEIREKRDRYAGNRY